MFKVDFLDKNKLLQESSNNILNNQTISMYEEQNLNENSYIMGFFAFVIYNFILQ